MTRRSIRLFMWGYQEHYTKSIEYLAENVLSNIGAAPDAEVLLVGVRRPNSRAPYAVCIEPESGRWPLSLFEGLDAQVFEEIPKHHLSRTVYGDEASMRDKPEQTRQAVISEQVRARLAEYDKLNDVISFIVTSGPIEEYNVTVVLQVPGVGLRAHPELKGKSWDNQEYDMSFIRSCLKGVLRVAKSSLLRPDPGRGVHDDMPSASEVNDRRAHITMKPDGEVDVSCSWRATSAVGFHEGWEKLLEKETATLLISAAGKAIEPITNPAMKRPLATRLTDAVGWFGDAVREDSPAAQIVKAITALETLVMTGERIEIASEVSARAAALCFDPERDGTYEEVNKEMSHAYDMRSRLAHGSLSPFDAEVTQYARQCLYWAERAIGGALVLFESHGLLERDLSSKELKDGLARLIMAAKLLSDNRSKASEHAQDGRSG
jgi:Apea-like HEPN